MRLESSLKGLGYLISTVSVVLLGIVAWKGASEQPLLLALLIAGMAASILGMCLRWISHRLDQKAKDRIEARTDGFEARTTPAPVDIRHARRA